MDEQGVKLVGIVELLVWGVDWWVKEFQSCLIGELSNFWVYDLGFCVPIILLVFGVGKLNAWSYLFYATE